MYREYSCLGAMKFGRLVILEATGRISILMRIALKLMLDDRVFQRRFFGKCFKKLLNILPNFFFYLKVQSFRIIMENNFIQMPRLAMQYF